MEAALALRPWAASRGRRFAITAQASGASARTSPRILVVDDEEDIRESVEHLVPRLLPGAEVVTAGSAAEAMRALRAGGFDLVMSDYRMPERDGLSLLRELRQGNPRLPMVLFTAYPDRRLAEEARSLRIEFLPKPLGSRELSAALQKALRDR